MGTITQLRRPSKLTLVVIDGGNSLHYSRYVGRFRDVVCKSEEVLTAESVELLRLHPVKILGEYSPNVA